MSSSSLGTFLSPPPWAGPRRRRPRRRRRFRPRLRSLPSRLLPLFGLRSPDCEPELPPPLDDSEEGASEVFASTFGALF